MKKTVFAFSTLFLFFACNENSIEIKSQKSNLTSAVAAGSQNEAELNASLKEIKEEEEKRQQIEAQKNTTLTFNELEHDYGTVENDTDNTTFFIVKNTGKKPLIIEKVEASCGCTTPEKPEKPILPGKSDKIKVVFHPKPGQTGEQNKTVTVSSNTSPRLTVLKIKAFVK